MNEKRDYIEYEEAFEDWVWERRTLHLLRNGDKNIIGWLGRIFTNPVSLIWRLLLGTIVYLVVSALAGHALMNIRSGFMWFGYVFFPCVIALIIKSYIEYMNDYETEGDYGIPYCILMLAAFFVSRFVYNHLLHFLIVAVIIAVLIVFLGLRSIKRNNYANSNPRPVRPEGYEKA